MYNADDVSISVVSKEPKYELHVAEDMFKQYDKCIQNSKGSLWRREVWMPKHS